MWQKYNLSGCAFPPSISQDASRVATSARIAKLKDRLKGEFIYEQAKSARTAESAAG